MLRLDHLLEIDGNRQVSTKGKDALLRRGQYFYIFNMPLSLLRALRRGVTENAEKRKKTIQENVTSIGGHMSSLGRLR